MIGRDRKGDPVEYYRHELDEWMNNKTFIDAVEQGYYELTTPKDRRARIIASRSNEGKFVLGFEM